MDDQQTASESAPPQWAAQLFQMIQTQNEQMVLQSQRIAAFEQQLGRRRDGSTPTPESSTSPVVEVVREPEAGRQKAKLPELAEFSGKRTEFRPWLTQVRAKLAVDKEKETEIVRFWYIHSRLRGDALSQTSSWVDSVQSTSEMTTEGLIGQLRAAYDDVDTAERASRKLSQMKQEGKTFSVFLAEFDRTLLDAGGRTWTDQVKRTFLSNCLSYELRNALVATPIPPTYKEYCTLLHTVSTNLEGLRRQKGQAKGLSTASYEAEPSSAADPMDWEPAVRAAAATRPQRAQWVSQDILDKRRETGACLRCGTKGHFVRECALGRASPPKQRTRVAVVETVHEESLKE